MKVLKQKTLGTIREMTEMKKAQHKRPTMPTMLELRRLLGAQVEDALRDLYREGKISYHYNVNRIPMFEITHSNNE